MQPTVTRKTINREIVQKKYICKICKTGFIHRENFTLHCDLNHKNTSPLYNMFNFGNICNVCDN